MDKSCHNCNYYLPRETICLARNELGRTAEKYEIKKALSFGKCEDFKEKPFYYTPDRFLETLEKKNS